MTIVATGMTIVGFRMTIVVARMTIVGFRMTNGMSS